MSTGNTGTVSSHFNFTLPGYDDDTDIDELNTNFNIIDTSLYDAVQDIAQNASAINTLRDSVLTKLNPIKVSGSVAYSVAANSNGDVTIYFTIPSGYMMISTAIEAFGSPYMIIRAIDYEIGDTFARVYIRNLSSSTVSNTLKMYALCIKTG